MAVEEFQDIREKIGSRIASIGMLEAKMKREPRSVELKYANY